MVISVYKKFFMFFIVCCLIKQGGVAVFFLDQGRRIALQRQLKAILELNPNIPASGGWGNHCCLNGGMPVAGGLDPAHRNVLKLIVSANANAVCENKMRLVINAAVNRMAHNAEVTANHEIAITPTGNDGLPTHFPFHCWKPNLNRVVQGPDGIVLQIAGNRQGFC